VTVRYLIDSDILSTIRLGFGKNYGLDAFLAITPPETLFISYITIGEQSKGVQRVVDSQPQFALDLTRWLVKTIGEYSDRLVMFDAECAMAWGVVCAELPNEALDKNHADVLLAATAIAKGMTVLTKNTKHFCPVPGLNFHNPCT
jgi:predicted nucleic acid-binding protein